MDKFVVTNVQSKRERPMSAAVARRHMSPALSERKALQEQAGLALYGRVNNGGALARPQSALPTAARRPGSAFTGTAPTARPQSAVTAGTRAMTQSSEAGRLEAAIAAAARKPPKPSMDASYPGGVAPPRAQSAGAMFAGGGIPSTEMGSTFQEQVEARGFFIGPHEGDPLGGAHYARFVGSGKNSLGVEVPVVPLGEDVNSEEALLWSPVSPKVNAPNLRREAAIGLAKSLDIGFEQVRMESHAASVEALRSNPRAMSPSKMSAAQRDEHDSKERERNLQELLDRQAVTQAGFVSACRHIGVVCGQYGCLLDLLRVESQRTVHTLHDMYLDANVSREDALRQKRKAIQERNMAFEAAKEAEERRKKAEKDLIPALERAEARERQAQALIEQAEEKMKEAEKMVSLAYADVKEREEFAAATARRDALTLSEALREEALRAWEVERSRYAVFVGSLRDRLEEVRMSQDVYARAMGRAATSAVDRHRDKHPRDWVDLFREAADEVSYQLRGRRETVRERKWRERASAYQALSEMYFEARMADQTSDLGNLLRKAADRNDAGRLPHAMPTVVPFTVGGDPSLVIEAPKEHTSRRRAVRRPAKKETDVNISMENLSMVPDEEGVSEATIERSAARMAAEITGDELKSGKELAVAELPLAEKHNSYGFTMQLGGYRVLGNPVEPLESSMPTVEEDTDLSLVALRHGNLAMMKPGGEGDDASNDFESILASLPKKMPLVVAYRACIISKKRLKMEREAGFATVQDLTAFLRALPHLGHVVCVTSVGIVTNEDGKQVTATPGIAAKAGNGLSIFTPEISQDVAVAPVIPPELQHLRNALMRLGSVFAADTVISPEGSAAKWSMVGVPGARFRAIEGPETARCVLARLPAHFGGGYEPLNARDAHMFWRTYFSDVSEGEACRLDVMFRTHDDTIRAIFRYYSNLLNETTPFFGAKGKKKKKAKKSKKPKPPPPPRPVDVTYPKFMSERSFLAFAMDASNATPWGLETSSSGSDGAGAASGYESGYDGVSTRRGERAYAAAQQAYRAVFNSPDLDPSLTGGLRQGTLEEGLSYLQFVGACAMLARLCANPDGRIGVETDDDFDTTESKAHREEVDESFDLNVSAASKGIEPAITMSQRPMTARGPLSVGVKPADAVAESLRRVVVVSLDGSLIRGGEQNDASALDQRPQAMSFGIRIIGRKVGLLFNPYAVLQVARRQSVQMALLTTESNKQNVIEGFRRKSGHTFEGFMQFMFNAAEGTKVLTKKVMGDQAKLLRLQRSAQIAFMCTCLGFADCDAEQAIPFGGSGANSYNQLLSHGGAGAAFASSYAYDVKIDVRRPMHRELPVTFDTLCLASAAIAHFFGKGPKVKKKKKKKQDRAAELAAMAAEQEKYANQLEKKAIEIAKCIGEFAVMP